MPSVDGIVSGLNTSAIIKAMVDAEAVPKKVLESRISFDKNRLEKIAGIKSRLETVSTKLAAMSTSAKFASKALTNTDDAQFSAAVTDADELAVGSTDIRVTSLAKAPMFLSGGYAAPTAAVSQGTYDVNVGGVSHNVTITAADDDLSGLAAALDNVSGINARVVDRGPTYTSDRYKILVAGDNPGSANTVTIANPSSGTPGLDPDWSTIIQGASNAELEIGGAPSPLLISSASNTVENALPGVTLTLKAVGVSAANVGVTVDTAQIEENIQGFVTAYNDVIAYYNLNNAYDATTGERGALFGDGSVRQVITNLGNQLSGTFITGGAFNSLSMIGIQTQRDGTLEFNTDASKGQTLSGALDDNFSDVELLFTAGWTTETATGDDGPGRALAAVIDDLFVDATNGILTSASSSLEAKIEDAEDRVDVLTTRLTSYEERLRKQYTMLETVLSQIKNNMSYITAAFGLQSSNNE